MAKLCRDLYALIEEFGFFLLVPVLIFLFRGI